MKTMHRWNWKDGSTIVRRLSRSFDTIGEATKFAEGKEIVDIYKSKGRYKVEWIKTKDNND